MTPLFSQEQFAGAKSKDKLPCRCENCSSTFYKVKHDLVKILNGTMKSGSGRFCSQKCGFEHRKREHRISKPCLNCGEGFESLASSAAKFCCQSCSASHNNQNKTHGIRRSKLEAWLEIKLTELYPDLEIHFNRKDAINSELDIYIPNLKIAFELNGIFHYEPVYGNGKLDKIQNNDHRKFAACHEAGISLCVIDTSSQKKFTELSSQKFLDTILKLTSARLGLEPR